MNSQEQRGIHHTSAKEESQKLATKFAIECLTGWGVDSRVYTRLGVEIAHHFEWKCDDPLSRGVKTSGGLRALMDGMKQDKDSPCSGGED